MSWTGAHPVKLARGGRALEAARTVADNRGMREDDDTKPIAPEAPLPGDCCDSGCDPCVYDLYAEETAAYREKMAAWRLRHPQDDA
jgi:hypothetical protein